MKNIETFDLSNNVFFTLSAIFVRKIDMELDSEFKVSSLNSLFNKVVSNSNPEFKYELLRFRPTYENDNLVENSWRYDRIITEQLFKYLTPTGSDGSVEIIDSEFHFETNLYRFRTLNYSVISKRFPIQKSLFVERIRKEDFRVDKLNYNLIFGT